MGKNIVQVYEDRENLLKYFNDSLNFERMKFFEGSKLGSPVVINQDLTKNWLEINYLFSTQFRVGSLPGVGEIGADIITIKQLDGRYLAVQLALLDLTVRALTDYRGVEKTCADWLINAEKYKEEISGLQEKVNSLTEKNKELEEYKNLTQRSEAYIGFSYTGLPSIEFIERLGKLSKCLGSLEGKGISDTEKLATKLSQELGKYSTAVLELAKIRKYHKGIPRISDGMVRINTPAASGGLCMHTHPAYDDCYNSLPGVNDLAILAAQCGTVGIFHIGGGQTQGEHYIMHIPRKIFFSDVAEIVNKKNLTNEQEIMRVKQEVLDKRLEELIADEILGFKVSKAEHGEKIALLSPVVSSSEYEANKKFFESSGFSPVEFAAKEVLLDVGNGLIPYNSEIKKVISEYIGEFFKKSEEGGSEK